MLHTLALLLTGIHIGAGVACLTVGGVIFARAKGGGAHRRWGRTFLILMAALGATAFTLSFLRFNGFFFVLATFSFYLAFSGWRVLQRKRPELGQRAEALDWWVALATVAVGGAAVGLDLVGRLPGDPVFVLSILSGAAAVAVYDLSRFVRPLPAMPHLWLFEHFAKMIGSYIAVVSAFSATVLKSLPEPLRQLWPVLVGIPIVVGLIVRYRRRLAG